MGCGREGALVCRRCRDSLSRIQPPICLRCGRPQSVCRGCVDRLPALDGIRSPFVFEGTIRKAVHDFKYHNIRSLAPELACLLVDYLETDPVPGDLLLPVPLHPARLRERGYNQSWLLARELGRLSRIPARNDCLLRVRHTSPQVRTGRVEERLSNVAGAFACQVELRGQRIVIIDDVSTSGATLNACAAAARKAGAASVWGLTLAREI